MDANPLPELRYREGVKDKEYAVPTTILGEVTRADIDTVTIALRGRPTELYIDDLEPVLGGPDIALGLMLDAAEHHDHVKIVLGRERITYDNPAQLERFRAKA